MGDVQFTLIDAGRRILFEDPIEPLLQACQILGPARALIQDRSTDDDEAVRRKLGQHRRVTRDLWADAGAENDRRVQEAVLTQSRGPKNGVSGARSYVLVDRCRKWPRRFVVRD